MMKTLLFVLLLAAVALAARPHVASVRNEVNLGAEYQQDMEVSAAPVPLSLSHSHTLSRCSGADVRLCSAWLCSSA